MCTSFPALQSIHTIGIDCPLPARFPEIVTIMDIRIILYKIRGIAVYFWTSILECTAAVLNPKQLHKTRMHCFTCLREKNDLASLCFSKVHEVFRVPHWKPVINVALTLSTVSLFIIYCTY
jgi:hypothetical protein